ncbi:MAG: FAD-dependent oxidoreductase, partial [Peptostreptococcaceae bacterium]
MDCEYHEKLNLPLDVKGAISFKNQAQFNPKKYIDELIKVCVNLGVKVYENTPIVNLEKGEICELTSKDKNSIKAHNLVIASHVPWYDGLNFYFAKQKGDRSYLLGYDLKTNFEKGMFLNVEDSSRTFRVYDGENKNLLIIGGGKHKVGQGKKEELIYDELDKFAKEKFEV